jgi:ATP:cob(I)alamin adenosyltransferase
MKKTAGDEGKTGLIGGTIVSKDDQRVEAYGSVDELSSVIGLAKHAVVVGGFKDVLLDIQHDLYKLSIPLATPEKVENEEFLQEELEKIEELLEFLQNRIQLSGFVLPGACESSARLDVARTICRRVERCVVTLEKSVEIPAIIGAYLNRLANLLFYMARTEEEDA